MQQQMMQEENDFEKQDMTNTFSDSSKTGSLTTKL